MSTHPDRRTTINQSADIPANHTYAQQAIDYTDFPLDEIVLYLSATEEEFVLMLRSEY